MSSTAFARGANSLLSKPSIRKAYQRKCSSSSERTKLDTEEVNKKSINEWIPDERTGIYYPKGHEKVMQGIPLTAARDHPQVHWFNDDSYA